MDHPIISAITAEEEAADRTLAEARRQAADLISDARGEALHCEEEAALAAEKAFAEAKETAAKQAEDEQQAGREEIAEAVLALKAAAAPRLNQAAAAVVAYLKQ